MEEWKECQIGATSIMLIDGDRGKNYPSQNEFSPIGFCLFLNAGNVTKDGFSFEANLFITEEKDKILRNGKLQNNDIVITTRGTVGNVALYNENVPYKHLRINSGMLIVRGGIDFDSKYLYYYIKSQLFQNQIQQMKTGSAQPQLPKSTVVNMVVRYPQDISTQQKIANILSSLDDKIEVNRRINEQLEELAQALFKSWFVDFEPFKDGEFVESELGMIPEGWKVVSLDEMTSKFGTGLNPRKNFKLGEGDNYYVTIKNMSNNRFYLDDRCDKITNEAVQIINKRSKLKEGDLLFSGIGTIGRVALVTKTPTNWNTSESIFNMHPQEGYSSEFLYTLLLSDVFQNYVKIHAQGGVQQGIRMASLKQFTMPCPSVVDMSGFDDLIVPIISKIKKIDDETDHLTNLRDTLLPKLMSGEIDVNEVKI